MRMATKRGKQKQIRNVRAEECRRGNSHRSDLGGAIFQNLDGEDARKMCGQAFWGKRTDELGGHNEAKSREFGSHYPFLQRRTYGGAFAHKCVVERHNSQTGTMENFARRERNTRKKMIANERGPKRHLIHL
jgi:hypothetical protein